ncbi:Futalosine hydrolase [Streptomyces sp. YIM 130001]|uniref:futalosine hydrolase n=1 Tax=Streptomyces sp. YIM 130001 TaxID=2259644 RepID=UPI000EC0C60A|nr:futalosine hydrolase [Streptomyces sp. YIM 130001]RII11701.1 Futalosine hydrolase [Streptomyces sp. YIM 130001]
MTAVAAERDAVVAGLGGPPAQHELPAGTLARVPVPPHTAPDPLSYADVLVGGVGPAAVAAASGAALTAAALEGRPYGLVVSAGIGGGFAPGAPVGSVVVADAIVAADLGAQTPDGFVPVTGLGFGTVEHRPPAGLVQDVAAAAGAVVGTVLTVSTVTGSAARAAELTDHHPRALAEAMEGFGVAEAAAAHGCPVLEIRAVSNAVGPRDRAAWRIPEALAALTAAVAELGAARWQGSPPARAIGRKNPS